MTGGFIVNPWTGAASSAVRAIAGLLLAIPACDAQQVSSMYSNDVLEKSLLQYQGNLQGLWKRDLVSKLSSDERARAGDVSLTLELRGDQLIQAYSIVPMKQVVLPMSTVKFIDDLSIVFAYYERNRCDHTFVADYLSAIRSRPDIARGSPLQALGVPGDAISDSFVDDVSQKLLKSTVYFLLAHEYAHVMYRHKPYDKITEAEARAQEEASDAFALDVMRRIGVPPMSMAFFFLSVSRLEKTSGDFATPEEYAEYLKSLATHPVSGSRIAKIANGIASNLDAFSNSPSNPQSDPQAIKRALQEVVLDLREIGRRVDDPATRAAFDERGRTVKLADLACHER